jgi:cellulose synthase/poly-beta-1,6-N-acetylglucosamine synthase-like glycosyltransferase
MNTLHVEQSQHVEAANVGEANPKSTLSRKKIIGTVGYMGGIMSLPEPFVWSWTQMVEFNSEALCQEDQQIHYTRAQVSLHAAARNELAEKMRGDWLLQLDTDLVFDPDFCARLVRTMESYKIDILTGVYAYKSNPNVPTLYHFNETTRRHEPIAIPREAHDMEIFEIDSAGGGCLLVRRSIFERIVTELHESPFDMIPPCGEDHSFFMRARKLGIKAYCAWKVQAAHLGYKQVLYEQDHELPTLTHYAATAARKGALPA